MGSPNCSNCDSEMRLASVKAANPDKTAWKCDECGSVDLIREVAE